MATCISFISELIWSSNKVDQKLTTSFSLQNMIYWVSLFTKESSNETKIPGSYLHGLALHLYKATGTCSVFWANCCSNILRDFTHVMDSIKKMKTEYMKHLSQKTNKQTGKGKLNKHTDQADHCWSLLKKSVDSSLSRYLHRTFLYGHQIICKIVVLQAHILYCDHTESRKTPPQLELDWKQKHKVENPRKIDECIYDPE